MGYKIVYANGKKQKKHRLRRLLLTAVFFLLFLLYMQSSRQEQLEALRQWAIPDAAEAFVQQLQNGDKIGEAVDAFCQELIHGR